MCARAVAAVKKLSYYRRYFSDRRIPRSYSVDSQLSVRYGSGHRHPLHHSTVPETNIATCIRSNRHDCQLDTALRPRTSSVQVCDTPVVANCLRVANYPFPALFRRDSVVNEEINYDLLMTADGIQSGRISCSQLLGDRLLANSKTKETIPPAVQKVYSCTP